MKKAILLNEIYELLHNSISPTSLKGICNSYIAVDNSSIKINEIDYYSTTQSKFSSGYNLFFGDIVFSEICFKYKHTEKINVGGIKIYKIKDIFINGENIKGLKAYVYDHKIFFSFKNFNIKDKEKINRSILLNLSL